MFELTNCRNALWTKWAEKLPSDVFFQFNNVNYKKSKLKEIIPRLNLSRQTPNSKKSNSIILQNKNIEIHLLLLFEDKEIGSSFKW